MRFAITALAAVSLCVVLAGAASAGIVAFYDPAGTLTAVDAPGANTPAAALNALVAGPTHGFLSAIPKGTSILSQSIIGDTVTIEFSPKILAGVAGEVELASIYDQVKATLLQFGLDRSIKLQCKGSLLSDYLKPVEPVPTRSLALAAELPAGAAASSLVGRSVTLSPGHGIFWNGSGWYTQRPVYCAPLSEEDFHTVDIITYLKSYLEADGMLVKMCRETDKSLCCHATGNPWWKMASNYYLQNQGYPCSVYANYSGDCTTGTGASESNDDIRARPCASNYDNTDIYIAVHTNGFAGDCFGGTCPSGTETYYDLTSKEHRAYGVVSQNLANAVNPAIMAAITQNADPSWTCHGACTKDAAGNYGEIRVANRAAILTELAFHDSCDRDAARLRDPFFTSAAMWGEYKGICDYFGVAPGFGFYSDEYVSDDIPATMGPGEVRTVHITMRNRGVVWNEAHAIRLGAVDDSDPFVASDRVTISGDVAPGQEYTFTLTFTAPTTTGTYVTDWRMVREAVTWFGVTLTKSVIVDAPDTQAPSVPANLAATAVSSTQINLSWSPSTDNYGVTGYKIFRDSVQIGSSATNSYSDTTCAPNTAYTYTVSAYDAAANESAQSAPASATTPGDTTPPVISGVTATPGTITCAIAWITNEAATSQVEYGQTTAYGSITTLDPSLVTSHSVGLTGLVKRTTYHYRVKSKDASNNEAVSGDYTFTTKSR
jgi:N-acetylmuramoyl-L-alanine amidase